MAWWIRVTLAVELGALTSIGVAWYLALRDEWSFTFTHSISVNIAAAGKPVHIGHGSVSDQYRPGFRRIVIAAQSGTLNALVAERISADMLGTDRTPGYAAGLEPVQRPQRPLWFAWVPRPREGEEGIVSVSGRAAGWPLLCVGSSRIERGGGTPVESAGAVAVVPKSWYSRASSSDPDVGAVMLIPIWSGLVVDAAVYSVPWAMVVLGVPARVGMAKTGIVWGVWV